MRLSPLFMAQRSSGDQRSIDLSVELTGATGTAQGAPISAAEEGALRNLPPSFVASQPRTFSNKGGSEGEATLATEAAQGQTSPLFGAHVTVYIDGAEVLAIAGTFRNELIWQVPTGGFGGESSYNSESQRKKQKQEHLRELQQKIRQMNKWR